MQKLFLASLFKEVSQIFEDFKRCSDYLKGIEVPGEVIRINATDFGYQSSEEVLAEIDVFMKA